MLYMDDTAQNKVQSSTQGDDAATQVSPQQQQQQPPPQPVGSVAKEHGPVSTKVESFIEPSGAETQPEVSVELQEHGVEAIADQERPQLTESHKQVGIEHAKESVPAPTQVTNSSHVQLPMTEEEALQTIKSTGTSDSKHWLALLVEKVYMKLRLVHEKLTK